MRPELDPSALTPEERLDELASILAAAILRLRDRGALAVQPPPHPVTENLPLASPEPLEVPADPSVTVHAG